MAEQNGTAAPEEGRLQEESDQDQPILNPGRRPVDESVSQPVVSDEVRDEPADESTQSRRRLGALRDALQQCDRVLMLNEAILAMPGWPDDATMAMARRWRDLWLVGLLVCTLLLSAGAVSLVPAWIGGGSFGLLVVGLLMGVPSVRRTFTRQRSYTQLLLRRYQLLRLAREHVRELEGRGGLVWQCARLDGFNPTLRAARFSGLRRLSQRGQLVDFIRTRSHVRLYLMFMLESQKGYRRAQSAYLKGHRLALDNGWLEPDHEDGSNQGEQERDPA